MAVIFLSSERVPILNRLENNIARAIDKTFILFYSIYFI